MLGTSDTDQGSSWAVEVGGQLKVCSIIVENLNKNGQILVEVWFVKIYLLLIRAKQ